MSARARRSRCAAAVAALILTACGSVEEPKRQPPPAPVAVLGPSQGEPKQVLPADYGLGLDTFAATFTAAWRRDPAPVAVLPAFSEDPQHPRGTQVFANGAGDWLAARALDALRAAEPTLEAWAPETVVTELARSNRSLRDVRATQDAIPLVAQTDAGYLVYGNVEKAGGRLSGPAQVRVRITAVRLGSGEVTATCDRVIEAPEAVRDLMGRAERTSVILVGARAPDFTPSLDAEISLVAERALARLVGAHRALLAGQRCRVTVEPDADAGRTLAATARSALVSRLARALPGKDAITVVDAAGAKGGDLAIVASFDRGRDRYAFSLSVRSAARGDVRVTVPIDARFHAEMRRALP